MTTEQSKILSSNVHCCDWAQQPDIRILCDQSWHVPYKQIEGLPEGVHNADDYLYTFDVKKVTCTKCMNKEVYKESMNKVLEFDKKVADSGLTQSEYIEKIRKEALEKLRNKK